jgi:hypothetical protein
MLFTGIKAVYGVCNIVLFLFLYSQNTDRSDLSKQDKREVSNMMSILCFIFACALLRWTCDDSIHIFVIKLMGLISYIMLLFEFNICEYISRETKLVSFMYYFIIINLLLTCIVNTAPVAIMIAEGSSV